MWEVNYPKDTVIIQQGEDGYNMYILDSGQVQILYSEEEVGELGPGEVFGETALMYNCIRTATVKAKTPIKLWIIDRPTFRKLIMKESIRRRALYQVFLSKIPLFENLLPYEIAKVADALEQIEFEDGQVIIKQGSEVNPNLDGFYIIQSGQVICTKEADDKIEDSNPVEAIRLGEGDYFGELALISHQRRQASVICIGSVQCLYITKKDFDQVMGPCEEILKRNTKTYASYENLLKGEKQQKTRSKSEELLGKNLEKNLVEASPNRIELLKNSIQIEKVYLENLNILINQYLKPIQAQTDLNFTSNDISVIFMNVEELHNIHSLFLDLLNSSLSNPIKIYDFLQILLEKLPRYLPFVKTFYNSLIARKNCLTVPSLAQFLKRLQSNHQSLDNLLSLPIQHINYYPTLVLNIIKTSSSIEHTKLFPFLDRFKKIMDDLENTRVNAEEIYNIEKNINGGFDFVENPERRLIFQGNLMCISQDSNETFYCYLFNDIMILTTSIQNIKGKDTLVHNRTINLNNCTFENQDNQFTLKWNKNGKNESLSFKNDLEWKNHIQSTLKKNLQIELTNS